MHRVVRYAHQCSEAPLCPAKGLEASAKLGGGHIPAQQFAATVSIQR